jgi:hypothetical protein
MRLLWNEWYRRLHHTKTAQAEEKPQAEEKKNGKKRKKTSP